MRSTHGVVSVVVLSFRQEQYIEATLDSIAQQTALDIELIVTDDASSDDTFGKVERWAKQNESRFVRISLICSPVNQGITKNIQQGLRVVTGEYIKLIGGDDLLSPTCLADFLGNPLINEPCVWVGKLDFIDENGRPLPRLGLLPPSNDLPYFQLSADQQFIQLQKRNWVPSAGCFFSATVARRFGLFQKGFRLLDDWPTWVSATRQGCPIRLLPIVAANYRVHPGGTWISMSFFRRGYYRVGVLRTFAGLSWLRIAILIAGGCRQKCLRGIGRLRSASVD